VGQRGTQHQHADEPGKRFPGAPRTPCHDELHPHGIDTRERESGQEAGRGRHREIARGKNKRGIGQRAGTGGQGAGLAYQILMAGIQLNVPRLFAALVLITLAGVALYLAVSVLSRYALARWHESELARSD
jgi:hypothetical protein